jgi:predicted acylesterase/phospholipase RssA
MKIARPLNHVVLSVGGARGAVQPWVIKAQAIEGDAFYGSSVGALNAAMLATGQLDACLDLWNNISNKDVYSRKYNVFYAALALVRNRSILNLDPLRKLMDKHLLGRDLLFPLTVEYVSFDNSLTTYSMPAGAVIGAGDIEAIYRSSAIPFVFPTDNHADGGLIRPIPLKPAIEAATPDDNIIIISCHPVAQYSKDDGKIGELKKLSCSLDIMQSALVRAAVEPFHFINELMRANELKEFNGLKRFNSTVYAPKEPLPIGMLDFDSARPHIGQLLLT